MNTRKLIISCCDQCPHFNNEYYGYEETCRKLDRKIEKNNEMDYESRFPIPDDCPLDKE